VADHDQDRFPVLTEVLSRILEECESAQAEVERIEINLLASGEATYRIWAPKAEEADSGYFAAATS
jgi:hypothetical protein